MGAVSEEWGPWIDHDGKGCPVPVGTAVRVECRDGEIVEGIAGCMSEGQYVGPHGGESDIYSCWTWYCLPRPGEVLRYRIRKPRALEQLRKLAQDVEKVREMS